MSSSRMPASRQFRSSADKHVLRHHVNERPPLIPRGDDVVDGADRALRQRDLPAARAQHVERLRRRDLVNQVETDEQLGLPVWQPPHRVRVPDLLEKRRCHEGEMVIAPAVRGVRGTRPAHAPDGTNGAFAYAHVGVSDANRMGRAELRAPQSAGVAHSAPGPLTRARRLAVLARLVFERWWSLRVGFVRCRGALAAASALRAMSPAVRVRRLCTVRD